MKNEFSTASRLTREIMELSEPLRSQCIGYLVELTGVATNGSLGRAKKRVRNTVRRRETSPGREGTHTRIVYDAMLEAGVGVYVQPAEIAKATKLGLQQVTSAMSMLKHRGLAVAQFVTKNGRQLRKKEYALI